MVAWLAFVAILQAQPEEVVYSHAGGVELHLDLYRGETASKPSPVMVLIHGGGWMAGDWRGMGWLADMFVPKGFVCASVEYRFSDKFKWPAQLDDVQTAVRFLRSHAKAYNIDPKRIGAAGDSAGGHLSQCLGVRDTRDPHPAEYPRYSSRVKAVWNLYGPTDFTQTFSDAVKGLIKSLLGEDTAANLQDASPFFFASEIGPDILHPRQERSASALAAGAADGGKAQGSRRRDEPELDRRDGTRARHAQRGTGRSGRTGGRLDARPPQVTKRGR